MKHSIHGLNSFIHFLKTLKCSSPLTVLNSPLSRSWNISLNTVLYKSSSFTKSLVASSSGITMNNLLSSSEICFPFLNEQSKFNLFDQAKNYNSENILSTVICHKNKHFDLECNVMDWSRIEFSTILSFVVLVYHNIDCNIYACWCM